eukprot:gnl/TRDRNA2_/TRDRNA2_63113_c0_seq1.p1 gnl/TRDRNA2_/TRDRNA2_63113_c0~~gnl/TRDRNA2_/TRDRNA2_63113_c0_seq1.p1  ORF type:complete len:331 (+),score=35.88 gnl/TRDRNA2_/TRDRNA2_63113_c0_seq1:23-1015(+)
MYTYMYVCLQLNRAQNKQIKQTNIQILFRPQTVEKNSRPRLVDMSKHELERLWMYKPLDRSRVKDFFECLQHPGWHLERVDDKPNSDYEFWRMPGETVHRVMGVVTVPAPPSVVFKQLKDPKKVFSYLFPTMFLGGQIIAEYEKGRAICHGAFSMPGPNPPISDRDFIWEQRLTKLSGGDMLFTAQSIPEKEALVICKNSAQPKDNRPPHQVLMDQWLDGVAEKLNELPFASELRKLPLVGSTMDRRVPGAAIEPAEVKLPKWNGAVRAELINSGWFGKAVTSEKKTHLYFIVQADPKGMLPKWLVNIAAARLSENVVMLADMFRCKRLG